MASEGKTTKPLMRIGLCFFFVGSLVYAGAELSYFVWFLFGMVPNVGSPMTNIVDNALPLGIGLAFFGLSLLALGFLRSKS